MQSTCSAELIIELYRAVRVFANKIAAQIAALQKSSNIYCAMYTSHCSRFLNRLEWRQLDKATDCFDSAADLAYPFSSI